MERSAIGAGTAHKNGGEVAQLAAVATEGTTIVEVVEETMAGKRCEAFSTAGDCQCQQQCRHALLDSNGLHEAVLTPIYVAVATKE